ncbi:MAG TPA: dihydroorotate dehydrogenase [bacterium]|nr:dihydroorotate dehydrogenase [bacterium]
MAQTPNLKVTIGTLTLPNPVLVCSGTYGFGEEFADIIDITKLGGIITKSITLRPKKGNPPQRIVETPSGMLNAIGLQNPGIDGFIKDKLPFLKKLKIPVIVNIAGDTPDEYAELARRVESLGVAAALELNISCPNVKKGGIAFGIDPHVTFEVVSGVRKATRLPVVTKLSPNVTDIVFLAKVAIDAGSDALSLINTLLGMSIDIQKMRPHIANITGGLSGPAIRPVAVRMIWQVARTYDIPIIGMGGVEDAASAVELLLAGASAVSVGTANFYNPRAPLEIVDGIRKYLVEKRIEDVNELRKSLKV